MNAGDLLFLLVPGSRGNLWSGFDSIGLALGFCFPFDLVFGDCWVVFPLRDDLH